MKNVLFLCTGNSCRSIMAEGILNHYGKDRFRAFSAGSSPTGNVHPLSLATLERHGMSSQGYESKSWDVFKNLADLDIVITVCGNAASEVCPIFPGAPIKAHWGVPDPAHVTGTPVEIAARFDQVFGSLERRVKALLALPESTMDKALLATALTSIGEL